MPSVLLQPDNNMIDENVTAQTHWSSLSNRCLFPLKTHIPVGKSKCNTEETLFPRFLAVMKYDHGEGIHLFNKITQYQL